MMHGMIELVCGIYECVSKKREGRGELFDVYNFRRLRYVFSHFLWFMDSFPLHFGVPFTNPLLFALLPGGKVRRGDVKCSSTYDSFDYFLIFFSDDYSVDVQVSDSFHLHCLVSIFLLFRRVHSSHR